MKFYQNKYPISDNIEYVIDYVCDNPTVENSYFQLVRLSDNAILYAAEEQTDAVMYCWNVVKCKNVIGLI